VRLGETQRLPSKRQAARLEVQLFGARAFVGDAPGPVVDAERLRHPAAAVDERRGVEPALADIHHRRDDLGAVFVTQDPAQQVGAGLGDGADRRVALAPDAWYLPDHGHEDVVGRLLGHAADQPVIQLYRRAERHVGFLDAAFEGLLADPARNGQLKAQVMEEGGEEREQTLEHELVAQGYPWAANPLGQPL
jgi:hypothetical protein